MAWKKLYTLSSLLKAVSIVSKDVNLENALLALDTITGSLRIWEHIDLLAAVLSSHISCSLVYHFEGSAVNAPSSQSVQISLNENSTCAAMLPSPIGQNFKEA